MKIVINSHKQTQNALNILLKTMKIYDEFNEYDVIVIVSGCETEYETITEGNITFIYSNIKKLDFKGIRTFMELYHDDKEEYYYYMNDTCKISSRFFKKLATFC